MIEPIKCPSCGKQIDLTDTFKRKITEEVEQKFNKRTEEAMDAVRSASRQELEALQQQLNRANSNELALRRQKTELEQKAKDIDLEVQRKLDEEKSVLESRVAERLAEAHRLKDSEKDRKLADALAQAEEMKRKIEQGSQQAQGETLEVELEQLLNSEFPLDSIEPVAKGVKGGDMVQTVKIRSGQECGSII